MPTFVGRVNEAACIGGNQKSIVNNARRSLDVGVESFAQQQSFCAGILDSLVSCINIVTVHFVWPRQIKHFMQPAPASTRLSRTMLFALAVGQFWALGGRVCGHGPLNWHWVEQSRDFSRLLRANFACRMPHALHNPWLSPQPEFKFHGWTLRVSVWLIIYRQEHWAPFALSYIERWLCVWVYWIYCYLTWT